MRISEDRIEQGTLPSNLDVFCIVEQMRERGLKKGGR